MIRSCHTFSSWCTATILTAFVVMWSATINPVVAKNWNDGTAPWNPGVWSPAGAPVANEAVNIVFTDGAPRAVTYNVSAPSLGLVSIDLTGAGTSAITLSLPSNFNLTAAGLFVGGYNGSGPTSGRGAIEQMDGTVTASISPGVILGHGAGSSGSYTLGGSGTLNSDVGSVYVGYNGTGTFNQNAGTVSINNNFLDMGRFATATGNYNLVSGSLTVREEYIGDVGTAYFTQTGGTNSVTGTIGLILGYAAGSHGTYAISGGSLTVDNNLAVGNAGTGTMTIGTGGSVYVTNNLAINSSSNLNLNGGTLQFSTATGLDRLNFNSGAVQIPSFDNAIVTSLFGATPVIPAGKALVVEGDVTLMSLPVTVQGGQLTANGTLQIVGVSLPVMDGGTLNAGRTFISPAPATSVASVSFTGPGTSANLGDLAVSGLATMTIANGAVVNSVTSTVGGASVTGCEVIVTGPGSIWHTSALNFSGGPGQLTIQDGGLVDAASVLLGTESAIILDGGTLRFKSSNKKNQGLSRITFNYGTAELTGNRTIGTDLTTADLFGSFPTISARVGFTVDGTATLATSFTVDGGTFTAGGLAGAANLHLLHGTLNVTNQALTVGPTGNLASGLDLLSDVTINSTLGITNQGLVTGDGQIGGPFANATTGEVRVTSGQSLRFTGSGNTSAGHINLYGGQVEFTQDLTNNTGALVSGNGTLITAGLTNQGTMNFSGLVNIVGNLTNAVGGKIISSGGGPTTFFSDVTNQGEIHTSPGGFTVFFGSLSGAGSFTGTGTVNVEGDLNPGNSPATVQFAGNLALDFATSLKIELGGAAPGAQYDQVHVTGQLSLDGKLEVSLLNGYTPAAGATFDILDWGSLSGNFPAIQLPVLGSSLAWNTSQLYTNGVLSVASAGLPGDYNGNGVVDAADYVVWRKNQGTTHTLPNDPIGGTIGTAQYDQWRSQFGQNAGSGLGAIANAAVPEPATCVLLVIAVAGWCLRRRRST